MNVKEIVAAKVKKMGADGLCTGGCGCGLDDFMPCCGEWSDITDCEPSRKIEITAGNYDQYRETHGTVEGDTIYVPMDDGKAGE